MAYEYYKQECSTYKIALGNTKRFLNMVIHDLRNPTSQIKFVIEESIEKLNKSQGMLEQFRSDLIKEENLKEKLVGKTRMLLSFNDQLSA